MNYLLLNVGADPNPHLNPTLLFGLIILAGTFGARLFQKMHIPQVVGCIVVGIILGDGLNLITQQTIEKLEPFTMFALGMIGFMIGGELRGDVFKKYGRQFFIILFSQGFAAFLLVAIGATVTTWFLVQNLYTALAVGLVLGAIASATAPAATVNVLWEYKTRGPLTAAVLAIVALDDALALLLYRAAATGAKALTGTASSESILKTAAILLGEVAGAILMGFLAGVVLYFLLKFVISEEKVLDFTIASLLIIVGISMIPRMDPILPAMVLGITIANLLPRQSKGLFQLVGKFSPPVYVSFFVLAGAHMEFGEFTNWIVIMVFVYVLCRAIGKVAGSWFGARYAGAPPTVSKYLGICLLPQAGVAIGLAILSGQLFTEVNPQLGKTIIMVVMTATFIMEILGPMFVKIGVKKAGEVGLNVTEEDLIKTYSVTDVMDAEPATIQQDLPLPQILEIFSSTEAVYYPVIDKQSQIIGIITIPGIKEMFANQDVAGWLLACDVAEAAKDKTTSDSPLEDAFDHMRKYDLEHLLVVQTGDGDTLVGVLDYRKAMRKISAEVLRRREAADGTALAAI